MLTSHRTASSMMAGRGEETRNEAVVCRPRGRDAFRHSIDVGRADAQTGDRQPDHRLRRRGDDDGPREIRGRCGPVFLRSDLRTTGPARSVVEAGELAPGGPGGEKGKGATLSPH